MAAPTGELRVPEDTAAERAIAATLTITGEALPGLDQHLQPEDFYTGAYRRIYQAAHHPNVSGLVGDARRQAIAELTAIPADELDQLAAAACFLRDGTPWARRVADAAARRRAMQAAADLYNTLAAGAALDDLVPLFVRLRQVEP